MQMLLNADLASHQGMPREYALKLTPTGKTNMFVFSEEDLPSFKAKSKARQDLANAGMPMSLLKPKAERVEKPTYEKRKRYEPFYKKAIPSAWLIP
jgi:transcription initiation factor TFIIF subunit beta